VTTKLYTSRIQHTYVPPPCPPATKQDDYQHDEHDDFNSNKDFNSTPENDSSTVNFPAGLKLKRKAK
jgi:hypothetical protein